MPLTSVTPALTLNLGMRWAYTQPVVEKDNRQANFDLTTGKEIFATNGSRESRALYKDYKKGFEPRLGFAWRASDRWVVRGAYGISQYMEGTGANLRTTLNPPYFVETNVTYNQTTGAGSIVPAFDLYARKRACVSESVKHVNPRPPQRSDNDEHFSSAEYVRDRSDGNRFRW